MSIKLMHAPTQQLTFLAGTSGVTRGEVAVLNADVVDDSGSNAAKAIGIFDESADAGKPVRVNVAGVSLAVAHDDAITEGDDLVSSSTGRVDTAAALTGGTAYIVGKALRDSDAAGQLIPILINCYTRPDSAS